jgi:transposase
VPPRRKPNKVISDLIPQKARPWATVEERQSQVERLKLLGHQRTEISRFLEVSVHTVDLDWTAVRRRRVAAWRSKIGDEVLAEIQGMVEENRREWAELKAQATTIQEKMGCLFGFLKSVDRLLKLYQIGGKFMADTVGVGVSEVYRASIMEAIRDVPEEVQEKFLDGLERYALAEGQRRAETYPCAGRRDGCMTRVSRPGAYCRRCAIDAD